MSLVCDTEMVRALFLPHVKGLFEKRKSNPFHNLASSKGAKIAAHYFMTSISPGEMGETRVLGIGSPRRYLLCFPMVVVG